MITLILTVVTCIYMMYLYIIEFMDKVIGSYGVLKAMSLMEIFIRTVKLSGYLHWVLNFVILLLLVETFSNYSVGKNCKKH